MTHYGPTPSLADYLADDDPNKFWRLSSGDHQNLLEEAVDDREALIQILRTVSAAVSRGERHWWLVVDETQPLTDGQARLFERLVDGDVSGRCRPFLRPDRAEASVNRSAPRRCRSVQGMPGGTSQSGSTGDS